MNQSPPKYSRAKMAFRTLKSKHRLFLFYDIPSFTEPQRCRALYYGRRQKHDFVTNYILENQSNGVEHAFLCVMRSLDRPTDSTGFKASTWATP